MQTITLNIKNDSALDKLVRLLKNFKKEEIEIINKEDIEDLKLLANTRDEQSVSFEEYLKNENKY